MMINKSSPFYQKGVFVIELALVSSFIVLCLAFVSDITVRQNVKGNLQRMSYSAVSIIKERKLLYDGEKLKEPDGPDDPDDFKDLFDIIKHSMHRTMPGFKPDNLQMVLEHISFPDEQPAEITLTLKGNKDQSCKSMTSLKKLGDLAFETSHGHKVSLYKVTLCYEGENWFGKLVKKDYSIIRASSIMIER